MLGLDHLVASSPSTSNRMFMTKPKTKVEKWRAWLEEQRVKNPQMRYCKRYPTQDWITPDLFAKKRTIEGIVTRVTDGDGFRLYHTPFPSRFWKPLATGLANQTISVRLAGVDAPELGRSGRRGQPYAKEAQDWMSSKVMGKVVSCQLLRRDKYGRAVAAVKLPDGTFLADESLRAGYTEVYRGADAVYGPGGLEGHLTLEKMAKKQKKGRWSGGTNIESPSEWRRRPTTKTRRDGKK